MKSDAGITTLAENLCTIDDQLGGRIIPKSVHEGHPVFGLHGKMPTKAAGVRDEFAAGSA